MKRWKAAPGDPNPVVTYFYYDGSNLIQEVNAATGNRLYVQGGRVDEIVASQVNGVWYHHHYDAQGNCILQSNTAGTVQVQYDYDAFGFPYIYNASGGKGASQTRFLFTGREWLSDLRLYDYRARIYQPELGRFLQPDPKAFEAGDYNLYRYCHNDPINRTDPTGLREEKKDEKNDERPVREVLKLRRTPIGSIIPQTIRYTESGNWLNTRIADHYKSGLEKESGDAGQTDARGTATPVEGSNDWNLDLHVDWFVDSEHHDSNVVTRELQHVEDLRNFSASFACELSGDVHLAGFPGRVAEKVRESQKKYDVPKGASGKGLDKPHNLARYPKQPAELPEFEDTASRVPYNPTSAPPY